MKLLVVLSDEAITISWFNRAFFSINYCNYVAKVVKLSKRKPILWIFLEIQGLFCYFRHWIFVKTGFHGTTEQNPSLTLCSVTSLCHHFVQSTSCMFSTRAKCFMLLVTTIMSFATAVVAMSKSKSSIPTPAFVSRTFSRQKR